MTDLRQELAMQKFSEVNQEIEEALRQALAQSEQGNSSPNYPNTEPNTSFVDAVNMTQERVDETAKREHEPVAWFIQYEHRHEFLLRKPNELEQKTALEIKPLYTAPPISDYHEGWEEGFKAATREQEPVGYVTIENISSWAKVPSIKWFKKPTEGQLYTAPPKREWVGLTEDELNMIGDSMRTWNSHSLTDVYVAIEAKLKEKNT